MIGLIAGIYRKVVLYPVFLGPIALLPLRLGWGTLLMTRLTRF